MEYWINRVIALCLRIYFIPTGFIVFNNHIVTNIWFLRNRLLISTKIPGAQALADGQLDRSSHF